MDHIATLILMWLFVNLGIPAMIMWMKTDNERMLDEARRKRHNDSK